MLPPKACGDHRLALVVNSHVHYGAPVHVLLASLRLANFTKWRDLILVIGGSVRDESPAVMTAASALTREPSDGRDEVVTIRMASNAIDYHGLAALYRYRSHPLVAAETYLYVHDTVSAGPSFAQRFESFRLPRSPHIYTTWPLPNSNIAAFGAGVVHKYGANFDGNLSKADAFAAEFGYSVGTPASSSSSAGPTMRPLVAFGVVVRVGPRLFNGTVDMYGTGLARRRFWCAPARMTSPPAGTSPS